MVKGYCLTFEKTVEIILKINNKGDIRVFRIIKELK